MVRGSTNLNIPQKEFWTLTKGKKKLKYSSYIIIKKGKNERIIQFSQRHADKHLLFCSWRELRIYYREDNSCIYENGHAK